MDALCIVGLSILAACIYGIAHDQVTARICVEYFTVGHPRLIDTDSPTLLGLFWGVFATWWVGLLLGVPLSIAARAGNRPKRTARSLVRPIAMLAVAMGVIAFAAGVYAARLAERGSITLWKPLASDVPAEKHVVFLADLWAHNMSYFPGFVGGLVLIIRTWHSRGNNKGG
jgi:hypothetical protein